MSRFLKIWFCTFAIYIAGAYLLVISIYLISLSGWSDGPSEPLISSSVPQRLQEVLAYGVFLWTPLEHRVFLNPGKAPWIDRDASPEQEKIYAREIKLYYERVGSSRRRAIFVSIIWNLFVSACIAIAFYSLRRKKSLRECWHMGTNGH